MSSQLPFYTTEHIDLSKSKVKNALNAIFKILSNQSESEHAILLLNDSNLSFSSVLDFLNAEDSGNIGFISPYFSEDDDSKLLTFENLTFSSIIGTQAFYSQMEMKSFKNKINLGLIKESILKTEPYLRDISALFVDLNAIKKSDAPAKSGLSPIGLTAEEISSLIYFYGNGVYPKYLIIYNWDSECTEEDKNITSILLDNLVFYYQQGISKSENSNLKQTNHLLHYQVEMNNKTLEFIKNEISNKWWIVVDGKNIPCLYEDYKLLTEGEIPKNLWDLI